IGAQGLRIKFSRSCSLSALPLPSPRFSPILARRAVARGECRAAGIDGNDSPTCPGQPCALATRAGRGAWAERQAAARCRGVLRASAPYLCGCSVQARAAIPPPVRTPMTTISRFLAVLLAGAVAGGPSVVPAHAAAIDLTRVTPCDIAGYTEDPDPH